LEESAGVNQPDRVRVWSDEVEANIDRIMARPDYKDFTIGLWGVIRDKNKIAVKEQGSKRRQNIEIKSECCGA
jgi:hypothetical protein